MVKRLKLQVKKFWRLTPTFVVVTAENLVGGIFDEEAEFIQNFQKGEIYLTEENFVGKKFSCVT